MDARKVVLALPLSDAGRLPAFVEECLVRGVGLIAVAGDGCAEVEERIDCLVVGDGSDDTRFIATTSHPGEPLEEVIAFAEMWGVEGEVEVARL